MHMLRSPHMMQMMVNPQAMQALRQIINSPHLMQAAHGVAFSSSPAEVAPEVPKPTSEVPKDSDSDPRETLVTGRDEHCEKTDGELEAMLHEAVKELPQDG